MMSRGASEPQLLCDSVTLKSATFSTYFTFTMCGKETIGKKNAQTLSNKAQLLLSVLFQIFT